LLFESKNTKNRGCPLTLAILDNPLIDKAFTVFSVSVIVGDFLQFPMGHRHKSWHKVGRLKR